MPITITNYWKFHLFFRKSTRAWSKDQVEPILPLDSLKCLNYEGRCLPTAVPNHWESHVLSILSRVVRYQEASVNRNKTDGSQGSGWWRLPIGWAVRSLIGWVVLVSHWLAVPSVIGWAVARVEKTFLHPAGLVKKTLSQQQQGVLHESSPLDTK